MKFELDDRVTLTDAGIAITDGWAERQGAQQGQLERGSVTRCSPPTRRPGPGVKTTEQLKAYGKRGAEAAKKARRRAR